MLAVFEPRLAVQREGLTGPRHLRVRPGAGDDPTRAAPRPRNSTIASRASAIARRHQDRTRCDRSDGRVSAPLGEDVWRGDSHRRRAARPNERNSRGSSLARENQRFGPSARLLSTDSASSSRDCGAMQREQRLAELARQLPLGDRIRMRATRRSSGAGWRRPTGCARSGDRGARRTVGYDTP